MLRIFQGSSASFGQDTNPNPEISENKRDREGLGIVSSKLYIRIQSSAIAHFIEISLGRSLQSNKCFLTSKAFRREEFDTESRSSFKSMEDLEPISEVQQNLFCVQLMKRLNMQRRQDYLCDITLVGKEGKEFKAHRNVLSAVSPFFARLFQSEMKEKEEGIIRFEEISASILEDVLEFIYTGRVMILDERNAKALIIAADFLLLVCLKTFAGRFLEQLLTNSNCISTFNNIIVEAQCQKTLKNQHCTHALDQHLSYALNQQNM